MTGDDAGAMAEELATVVQASGATCLNLRIHAPGVDPDAAQEQIGVLGRELLPRLRPAARRPCRGLSAARPANERVPVRLHRRDRDRFGHSAGAGSDRGAGGLEVADVAAHQRAVELGVEAVGRQELVVTAPLDDAAAVEHQDLVGADDGGQAMGDHHGGATRERRGQRLLHQRLVLGIEVAGGLVEHDDRGVLHQHPGDGEALALASRQAMAALADHGVVAVGQGHDHVVDLGGPAGLDQLHVRGLGAGEAQVLGDRVVEEVGVLRHHTDGGPQGVEGEVADVVAVDAEHALGDVVEARDQRRERGLARTRRADEGDELTGLDRGADVVEDLGAGAVVDRAARADLERPQRHLGARRVAERDVVDLDAADRVDQVDGPGPVDERVLEVEHLEDPVERDERRHDVDPGVGERRQRVVEPHHQRGHGRHGAQGDGAGDDHLAAEPVDEHRADRPDEGQGDHERAAVHGALDADVAHPPGAVAEGLRLAVALTEQLHQQGARHVEALGHLGVHGRVEVEALPGDRREAAPDPLGGDHEDRQQDQRQDRDPPLEQDHVGERRGQHDDVRDDRAERGRDRPLGADDVVVHAAHQRTGLGAGEEADRHGRHVVEQLHPQVVDEALTDARGVEALDEREPGDEQGGHERQTGEGVEQAPVPLGDGDVDDALEHVDRHEGEHRLEDDHDDEGDDRPAVGAGEAEDAAGGAAVELRPGDLVGVGVHHHVHRGRRSHGAVRLRPGVPDDSCAGRDRWPPSSPRGPDAPPAPSRAPVSGGGECGIRTHGEPKPTTAFEAAPFVRSGNSPSATLAAVRRGGRTQIGAFGLSAARRRSR